jgi:hypothetical protein
MSELNTIQAKPAKRKSRGAVVRVGALNGKVFDQFQITQLKDMALADGRAAAAEPGACNPRCGNPECDKCNPPFDYTGHLDVERVWYFGYDQAQRRFPSPEEAMQEGIEEAARQHLHFVLANKPRSFDEYESLTKK